MAELHQKLRKLCDDARITPKELGETIGVSKSTAYNWYNGVGKPDIDSGLKIARRFGVPLDWLADDAMDEPEEGLTPDQKFILEVASDIGYDLARKRITAAPESRPPVGESWAEIKARNDANR